MGQTFTKDKYEVAAAKKLFSELDSNHSGLLSLRQLLEAAPALNLLHSIPALYFLDDDKDGHYSVNEFCALVEYVHSEKRKVKKEVAQDPSLREFIEEASRAGVVDGSSLGRAHFRRMAHMRNIKSLYRNEDSLSRASSVESSSVFVKANHGNEIDEEFGEFQDDFVCDVCDASVARETEHDSAQKCQCDGKLASTKTHSRNASGKKRMSKKFSASSSSMLATGWSGASIEQQAPTVNMYSSQKEYRLEDDADNESRNHKETDGLSRCILSELAVEGLDMRSLDAAVMEKMSVSNIHWLAEHLRGKGMRESFMQWLWKLAKTECGENLSIEELKVFLYAISEDGIDLEELVFDRNNLIPLEQRVIAEFGTPSNAYLKVDEFMPFADLVTREYEYWEDRHLECIGPYELGRILGRGSSGIVRVGLNVELHGRFAVKMIKKGKCSDMSRLDREIQSLHTVAGHANIVSLHEVLENEESLFLVMELCGGGSLIDILRLYPDERLPEDVARFYLRQLFEALAFCHSHGVCHRDVRLENMLLSNNGVLKLTDFGHSGIYSPGWDIFQTSLVGSIYNLSPEQIAGSCYSGEKIDVWSAGIALYTLLVGRPPFMHEDNAQLLNVIMSGEYELPMFVSDEAFDLLQRMIRVNADERQSFEELLEHEWFRDLETAPIMDFVSFPVDAYYQKNTEMAEMIIASVFHEYDIHVHMGSLQKNESAPTLLSSEQQNGSSEWSLKCSCLNMDMKFSISLFTNMSNANRNSVVSNKRDVSGDVRIGDNRVDVVPEMSLGPSSMSSNPMPRSTSSIAGGRGVNIVRVRTSGVHSRRPTFDQLEVPVELESEPKAAALIRNVSRIQEVVSTYPAKAALAVTSSPAKSSPTIPSYSLKNGSLPNLKQLDLNESGVSEKNGGVHDREPPHLEVRLCEGDSCLFLKVCRKLKEVVLARMDVYAQQRRERKTRRGNGHDIPLKRIFSDAHFGNIQNTNGRTQSSVSGTPSPLSLR
eukprot:CAMPEP_0182445564 /NCGR_PEP_ID=MMETSP1172-20130603/3647_1 /TAXON_ID=708627 /ORGANISM="Timspurckia oligopyrenoides, Strain CCMP3278" /LENGTH=993 /DNA_ID=CAMNT_0024641361 /DNA_START=267 /DNA_END=3248 /DNA_ORIENTATION=+